MHAHRTPENRQQYWPHCFFSKNTLHPNTQIEIFQPFCFYISAINQTVAELKAEGIDCKGYVVDISNRQNVFEAAKQLKIEVGNVDILINNAGIVCCKPLWDLPEKVIESTYNVNILSHYWVNMADRQQLWLLSNRSTRNKPRDFHFFSAFRRMACADSEIFSTRNDGIQSRAHCYCCFSGRFARHIRLHRL